MYKSINTCWEIVNLLRLTLLTLNSGNFVASQAGVFRGVVLHCTCDIQAPRKVLITGHLVSEILN